MLLPNGLLLLSVDYFDKPVDPTGVRTVDPGYAVFQPDDIRRLIADAGSVGLELTSEPDLGCEEPALYWKSFGIGFTYILLAFTKTS